MYENLTLEVLFLMDFLIIQHQHDRHLCSYILKLLQDFIDTLYIYVALINI